MDTRSKATLSCAALMLLLATLAITFFVWLYISLETDPIKGWQEGPHTPGPSLKIYFSPEPSATARPSRR
jgi:hypothetical protein